MENEDRSLEGGGGFRMKTIGCRLTGKKDRQPEIRLRSYKFVKRSSCSNKKFVY